jgi:hypothetical protein
VAKLQLSDLLESVRRAVTESGSSGRGRGRLVWLVDDDMTITASALVRHLGHDRTENAVLMGPCDVVADQAEHQRSSFYYDERHQRLEAIGRVTRPQDCSFANTSAHRASGDSPLR